MEIYQDNLRTEIVIDSRAFHEQ